jgi:hypothetical protein
MPAGSPSAPRAPVLTFCANGLRTTSTAALLFLRNRKAKRGWNSAALEVPRAGSQVLARDNSSGSARRSLPSPSLVLDANPGRKVCVLSASMLGLNLAPGRRRRGSGSFTRPPGDCCWMSSVERAGSGCKRGQIPAGRVRFLPLPWRPPYGRLCKSIRDNRPVSFGGKTSDEA